MSARQWDATSYSCNASAVIPFPTAKSSKEYLFLDQLKCLEESFDPISELSTIKIQNENRNTSLECSDVEGFCGWRFDGGAELAQASVTSYLWLALANLQFYGVAPGLKPMTAQTHAFNSNRSFYNAWDRTAFFGIGEYDDSLDGFIVVHEWTHSLIDDLNPGLIGFQSQVLHEGMSDFLASDLFGESCFAPWEALEEPDRECVRELTSKRRFPHEMSWGDAHFDSVVFSSAVWELKEKLDSGLILEVLMESLIRSSKTIELPKFWNKMTQVYGRIQKERRLKDHKEFLLEVGRRRGFFQ